jgi:hypothetical protein
MVWVSGGYVGEIILSSPEHERLRVAKPEF